MTYTATELVARMKTEMARLMGIDTKMNEVGKAFRNRFKLPSNGPTSIRACLTGPGNPMLMVTQHLEVFAFGTNMPGWSREATPEEIASLPDSQGDKEVWGGDGPTKWMGVK